METITKNFDSTTDVPVWARQHPAAVALARVNLAFRCELWAATNARWRHFLLREARRPDCECSCAGANHASDYIG